VTATSLFFSIIASAFGLAYMVYGKRQSKIVPFIAGFGLCAYTYFVDTWVWLTVGSFGIEMGDFVSFVMDGRQEYVGRAINVACRLQSALKEKGGSPAYSALVSNRVYSEYFAGTTPHRVHKVTRRLRNIGSGAEFDCRRMWLVRPLQAANEPS